MSIYIYMYIQAFIHFGGEVVLFGGGGDVWEEFVPTGKNHDY